MTMLCISMTWQASSLTFRWLSLVLYKVAVESISIRFFSRPLGMGLGPLQLGKLRGFGTIWEKFQRV